MEITLHLTPITILAALALLLLLACWLITRDYGGGPGDALGTIAVYAAGLLVWLLAAVIILSVHYFSH